MKSEIPMEVQQLQELKRLFLDPHPFPTTIFDPRLEDFLAKKAKILEIDYGSMALAFLGLASVALGGKKKLQMGDWTEKAIVWLALIGKSGMGKTALLEAAGLSFVRQWQGDHFERYREAKEASEKRLQAWESLDKEGRAQQFPDGKPQDPPLPEQACTNLTTVESILELNAKQSEGVSIVSDELAALLDCKNQYKNGGGNDQAVFLEIWTGYSLTNNLCNKLRYLKDPFCSTIGGIQPQLMKKIINAQTIADGFASRFVYAFLQESEAVMHYTEKQKLEASITSEERQAMHCLFQRLLHQRKQDVLFALSPQAEHVVRDFQYTLDLQARQAEPYLFSSLRKLKTYVLRFALLLHCLDGNSGPIDDQTALRACVVIQYLMENTIKAFHLVFQNETEEQQQMILEKVRAMNGQATREKVKQRLRKSMDFKLSGHLIEAMLKAEVLCEVRHEGSREIYLELKNA